MWQNEGLDLGQSVCVTESLALLKALDLQFWS